MLAPAIVDKAGAEAEFSGISATIDALNGWLPAASAFAAILRLG
jgi:hypothetical protein